MKRDHTQGSLSPQRLPAPFWWEGGRRGEANEKGCLFAFRNGVESGEKGGWSKNICFSVSGYN